MHFFTCAGTIQNNCCSSWNLILFLKISKFPIVSSSKRLQSSSNVRKVFHCLSTLQIPISRLSLFSISISSPMKSEQEFHHDIIRYVFQLYLRSRFSTHRFSLSAYMRFAHRDPLQRHPGQKSLTLYHVETIVLQSKFSNVSNFRKWPVEPVKENRTLPDFSNGLNSFVFLKMDICFCGTYRSLPSLSFPMIYNEQKYSKVPAPSILIAIELRACQTILVAHCFLPCPKGYLTKNSSPAPGRKSCSYSCCQAYEVQYSFWSTSSFAHTTSEFGFVLLNSFSDVWFSTLLLTYLPALPSSL